MNNVIRAIEETQVGSPLLFLAGPIQGAAPWQEEAITILRSLDSSLYIASPRSLNKDIPGWTYTKQVDWETRYLNRAAAQGVILFWLAKEQLHHPDRAYAQTSRFELAEWKERHRRSAAQLVLGIEPGFSGERYIRHRLAQECSDIVIHSTLVDTCENAVAAAR